MSAPVSIERVRGGHPMDFVRDYVEPRRPVIMTDVANRWPAVSLWSADYFAREHGRTSVNVEVQGERDPKRYFPARRYERMDLAEFVQRLPSEQPHYYLSQWDALEELPGLRQHIVPLDDYQPCTPRALGRWMRLPTNFWFGAAGTFTTLHYDPADNLYVQIWGRKRIVLYAPDQSEYMHRSHALCQEQKLCLTLFSPVDVESPDLERHPHFARARAHVCELQPGEILYIPVGWWHYLVSLDPSISLSNWWYRAPMQRRRAVDLGVAAACTLRQAARRAARRLNPSA
jgi:lysine-specific demethylase 8